MEEVNIKKKLLKKLFDLKKNCIFEFVLFHFGIDIFYL